MVKCCAICKRQYKRAECRSYHLFPNDSLTRRQWLQILGNENLHVTKTTVICSDHFTADSFVEMPSGKKFLKPGVLPLASHPLPTASTSWQEQSVPMKDRRQEKRPRLESLNTWDSVRNVNYDKYPERSSKRSKSDLPTTQMLTTDTKISTAVENLAEENASSNIPISSPESQNIFEGVVIRGDKMCTHHDSQSSITVSATENQEDYIIATSSEKQQFSNNSSTISAPELTNVPESTVTQNQKLFTYHGSQSPDSSSTTTISAPELQNVGDRTSVPKHKLFTYHDSLSSETLSATEDQNDSSSAITMSASEVQNVGEKTRVPKHKLRQKLRYFGDCSSNGMNSPTRATESWRIAKKTVFMQRKKIKNLQTSRRRLKARIYNLNTLVKYLQEKYGVTESAASVIKASLPDSTAAELFTRMLKGSSTKKFSAQLRSFAITLSFYSSRAYNHVRNTFNKSLPHISTISKWFRTIDGGPGFTKQSLEAINMKVSENNLRSKKTLCNLVMDEMAIMKQVQWTGKKFTGYVDIGTNLDSDEIPEAKEAIVFMLVSVNGHWKIPVGYFFIDGLNGNEKANIVLKLLEFLDDTGVIITSFTFDGISSNISMATTLGADFSNTSNLKTYFFHPKRCNQKIHIFLDIPHMLKLVRNCLASQQILTDGDGKQILWSYFQNLVNFESDQGLKAGTKIRKRHIEWFREKMKVKLAAQTFSKSSADAFRYLRDNIQLPQFQDVEATAVFTETFNNLFDIFNVHTIYSSYPYKRALNSETKEFIFQFLNDCKNYIDGIKLNGIPVLSTRRKTGFLGFLIAITSVQNIYLEYIEKNYLDFILTYKFSQDHLEIFFSAVRSRGGNNNNPTAFQFEHIYKRLLVHSQLKGSEHANVTALDCMSILHCSTLTKDANGENLLDNPAYRDFSEKINEMDFLSSPVWHLTTYCEDVVAYIAGFVAKCLKKCITCVTCLSLLESNEPLSKLQIKKTYGSMTNASKFLIDICKTGEKIFRVANASGNILRQNLIPTLLNKSLKNIPVSSLDAFGPHIYDTNHIFDSIKLILQKYYTIRIHHELKNLRDSNKRVRANLTKSLLFQHQ